jgi:hypothetical protein
MVWWRGGSAAECCRNSFRVPLRGSRAARGGGFRARGRAFFLGGRGFFWSFRSFKPYKSFDAVAEVNLYGLAEGGSEVKGCRNSFRVPLLGSGAARGGGGGLAGERFFWRYRIFWSFKPYKSFDAIAEVNLYGLLEGGVRWRSVETRSEFRPGGSRAARGGGFWARRRAFFLGGSRIFFGVSRKNHTSLLTRSRK